MGFVFYTNVNTMACATNMDTKDTIARVVIVFARAVSVMKSYNAIMRSDNDASKGIEKIYTCPAAGFIQYGNKKITCIRCL